MANKKSKALIVLSFLLIALFVQFSLVEAAWPIAKWFKADWWKEHILERYFGLDPEAPIQVTVIWFILFIMFFFAFSDIISTFTAFSRFTSYILGFGLALITATTRLIAYLSLVLFSVVGGLGALAIAVAIGTAFVVFIFIHLGLGRFEKWISERKKMIEAYEKITEAKIGLQSMKEVGKETLK
jgi:hypothetical protein